MENSLFNKKIERENQIDYFKKLLIKSFLT